MQTSDCIKVLDSINSIIEANATYVSDQTGFAGSMLLRSSAQGDVSGSGTIYIKEPTQTYGHLIADSGGRAAAVGSTPIRSVGRHVITDVNQVNNGVWEISVADTPWRATDQALGWGIDGIEVDLDASEDESALYLIEVNTVNTITINTLTDLSATVGNELIGTHTFQTIQERVLRVQRR